MVLKNVNDGILSEWSSQSGILSERLCPLLSYERPPQTVYTLLKEKTLLLHSRSAYNKKQKNPGPAQSHIIMASSSGPTVRGGPRTIVFGGIVATVEELAAQFANDPDTTVVTLASDPPDTAGFDRFGETMTSRLSSTGDGAPESTGTPVAQQVFGVFVCASGLEANVYLNKKFPSLRCATGHDDYTAQYSRLHNNAQVLNIGAEYVGVEVAKGMVKRFVNTDFEGGRHEGRVAKIHEGACKL